MATPATSATVIVGMSGGVDSSVAALLLKRAGYRVQGLFMKNWDEDDGTEYCTAREDLADAQRVCERLDVPLHTANFAAEYWDHVFEEFLTEYAAGRTPNPDVLCNREIKFKQFSRYALALGGDLIATGHYVRGHYVRGHHVSGAGGAEGSESAESFRLLKGIDPGKDQSYFLHAVPLAELAKCLFPLGDLYKHEVRAIAEQEGLHNFRKKDSTGICFIGERRFRDFLARYLPSQPGPIQDTAGTVLGQHMGLPYYTLGQRQGLGIGGLAGYSEAPWYVAGKQLGDNVLVVSQNPRDLQSNALVASAPNWLVPGLQQQLQLQPPLRCRAKVRYRQNDQACEVSAESEGRLMVRFEQPQRAVTPGQYVCFYEGDICLGGALIEQAMDQKHGS